MKNQKGLAAVPLMLGLALLVLAIPLTTNLVKNNQDNRSSAAPVSSTNNEGAGLGSEECRKINPGARCVASIRSKNNDDCMVNGIKGKVVLNKCTKQYNGTARCCVPSQTNNRTGDLGQLCNGSVFGECIKTSKIAKENSTCIIPDKNIEGKLIFGKCNSGSDQRCCKVNFPCATEGANYGCDGKNKIKVCVKDASSGIMGYVSKACPSGQTCIGSDYLAVCTAPTTNTGNVGQRCNGGETGECITASVTAKQYSKCVIPDSNIPGMLISNKCNGALINKCCKVDIPCNVENELSCAGTKIIKCTKDSSSGVMGWVEGSDCGNVGCQNGKCKQVDNKMTIFYNFRSGSDYRQLEKGMIVDSSISLRTYSKIINYAQITYCHSDLLKPVLTETKYNMEMPVVVSHVELGNNCARLIIKSADNTGSLPEGSAYEVIVKSEVINGGTRTLSIDNNNTYAIDSAGAKVFVEHSDGTQFGISVSGTSTLTPTLIPSKIDGVCGDLIDTCVQGKNAPFTENETQFLWDCTGINGGSTVHCSHNK